MVKAFGAAAAPLLLAGCAISYRSGHESFLMSVQVPRGAVESGKWSIARHAARFEKAITDMADDFEVPLEEVIPVRVFHEGDRSTGLSYYNRITGAIVLRGPLDPTVFVHEMSHLYAHHVARFPPYWADQALAAYVEARHAERSDRTSHIIWSIARADDSSDVLSHLSRSAVDEGRSWGPVVVRYLFEDRWGKRPFAEQVRRLLALTEADVAAIAPAVLEYCRRPDLLADTGSSPAR